MSERTLNRLVDLRARQLAGEHLPCPRCGMDTMKDKLHTNVLSRHADIYICDLCGTNEAMLDFMRNPLPAEDWSCMLRCHDGFQPDTMEEYIDVITAEHIPFLTALYQRWLDAGEQGDYRAYRDEALKRCSGLTELWTQPFQAEYRAKNGSRALVRFRVRDGEIRYGVDVIPK